MASNRLSQAASLVVAIIVLAPVAVTLMGAAALIKETSTCR